jgi:hypothetical protein
VRPEFDAGQELLFFPFAATSFCGNFAVPHQLAPSRVSSSRVIFCHGANISFVDLQKTVANVIGDLSSVTPLKQ